MANNIAFEKSEDLALRIVKLYVFLTKKKNENVISKQIIRCGTSIGANLAESVHGVSDGDFINKLSI